jgi:hypothetical protein
MTGEWPKGQDHKNLDATDNRWESLRDGATKSLNGGNTDLRADNTTGRKGVCWVKRARKWKAACQERFLGHFDNPIDAHRAYVVAATKAFGEFAKTYSREDERLTKELLAKLMKSDGK